MKDEDLIIASSARGSEDIVADNNEPYSPAVSINSAPSIRAMGDTTIEDMPDEILILIIEQLNLSRFQKFNTGDIHKDFMACCITVNKHWNSIAVPILYKHVVINRLHYSSFCHFDAEKYGPLVRSLTISIAGQLPIRNALGEPYQRGYIHRRVQRVGLMASGGSEEKRKTFDKISRLVDKLPDMLALESFSIAMESFDVKSHVGFWVPRQLLAKLVRALPNSCTSLEIDTLGIDRQEKSRREPDIWLPEEYETGENHLCAAIGHMLPGLEHVRLRVGTLCPALLGATLLRDLGSKELHLSRNMDGYLIPSTAAFPNLKTLSIPFVHDSTIPGACTRVCGLYNYESTNLESYIEDVCTAKKEPIVLLTNWLRREYERGQFPAAQLLQTIDYNSGGCFGNDVCDTYHLRDCMAGTTTLIPAPRTIVQGQAAQTGRDEEYVIRELRFPNGKTYTTLDVMDEYGASRSSETGLRIVEGGIWGKNQMGRRSWSIPKLISFYHGDAHRNIISNGNIDKNNIWQWEKVCGRTLLTGKVVDGIYERKLCGVRLPRDWEDIPEERKTGLQIARTLEETWIYPEFPELDEPFTRSSQYVDWPLDLGHDDDVTVIFS